MLKYRSLGEKEHTLEHWNTKVILTTKFQICFSEAGREKKKKRKKQRDQKSKHQNNAGKNLPRHGQGYQYWKIRKHRRN